MTWQDIETGSNFHTGHQSRSSSLYTQTCAIIKIDASLLIRLALLWLLCAAIKTDLCRQRPWHVNPQPSNLPYCLCGDSSCPALRCWPWQKAATVDWRDTDCQCEINLLLRTFTCRVFLPAEAEANRGGSHAVGGVGGSGRGLLRHGETTVISTGGKDSGVRVWVD